MMEAERTSETSAYFHYTRIEAEKNSEVIHQQGREQETRLMVT
jgi:hypothetical protein